MNKRMDILRLSILRRGKLAVIECNADATINNQKGYLCRMANYFSQNDLNCVMSAFLVKQMLSEKMVNS